MPILPFPQAPELTWYHVGTLDPARRGEKGPSHEGEGLSVSPCPEAWRTIARLGNAPVVRLHASNVRLLDVHVLTVDHHAAIAQWAQSAGWATPSQAWALSWFDDEINQTMTTWTLDREEAEAHADEHDQELDEADPEVARQESVLLPTAAYAARMGHVKAGHPSVLVPDGLAVCYAADVLGWDGAYWADRLDVHAHSAPRAVIVPGRLARFEVSPHVQPESPRNRRRSR